MNIKTKLLLPPLIGMFVFLGFLYFYWAPGQAEQAKARYEQRTRELLEAGRPDLTRSLREQDFAALFASLDAMAEDHQDEWRHLPLYDENGKRIYPLFEEGVTGHSHQEMIPIQQDVEIGGTRLGRIGVLVDWSAARAWARQSTLQLTWMVIGIMAVLFLVNVAGIQRLLYVPLIRLKQAANRLAKGDFEAELPAAGSDELGELTLAFDQMRGKLRGSLERIRSSEARQRAILETMGDGLLIIDRQGTIFSATPNISSASRFSGQSVDGRCGTSNGTWKGS